MADDKKKEEKPVKPASPKHSTRKIKGSFIDLEPFVGKDVKECFGLTTEEVMSRALKLRLEARDPEAELSPYKKTVRKKHPRKPAS